MNRRSVKHSVTSYYICHPRSVALAMPSHTRVREKRSRVVRCHLFLFEGLPTLRSSTPPLPPRPSCRIPPLELANHPPRSMREPMPARRGLWLFSVCAHHLITSSPLSVRYFFPKKLLDEMTNPTVLQRAYPNSLNVSTVRVPICRSHLSNLVASCCNSNMWS